MEVGNMIEQKLTDNRSIVAFGRYAAIKMGDDIGTRHTIRVGDYQPVKIETRGESLARIYYSDNIIRAVSISKSTITVL